jgi:hypothetical protein
LLQQHLIFAVPGRHGHLARGSLERARVEHGAIHAGHPDARRSRRQCLQRIAVREYRYQEVQPLHDVDGKAGVAKVLRHARLGAHDLRPHRGHGILGDRERDLQGIRHQVSQRRALQRRSVKRVAIGVHDQELGQSVVARRKRQRVVEIGAVKAIEHHLLGFVDQRACALLGDAHHQRGRVCQAPAIRQYLDRCHGRAHINQELDASARARGGLVLSVAGRQGY